MTLCVHGAQARLVHRKRSPDALTRARPRAAGGHSGSRPGEVRRDIPVLSVRANLPARLWRVSGVLSGPGGRRRRGHGGWTAAPAGGAAVGLGAAEPCQWSAILVSKVRTSVRSSWPRGRSGALVAPASAAAVFRRSRVGSQVDEERADGATGRTPGAGRWRLAGVRLVPRPGACPPRAGVVAPAASVCRGVAAAG